MKTDQITIEIFHLLFLMTLERKQVVSYLLPEYQEYYGSLKMWNEIQETVGIALEKLAS